MKLSYNLSKHQDELYILFPRCMVYNLKHYRETSLVSWLEENVGPSNEKMPDRYLDGDGWTMNGSVELMNDNSSKIKCDSWIEFDELSEELQLEFIMRFS